MYATIRGTFHQGDMWVFPPESVGKQCVANCAMAIIYIYICNACRSMAIRTFRLYISDRKQTLLDNS